MGKETMKRKMSIARQSFLLGKHLQKSCLKPQPWVRDQADYTSVSIEGMEHVKKHKQKKLKGHLHVF